MASHQAPEAKYPFHHKLDVQLRFNDIDIFGHVNNTVYLQFFDLGKLKYFEEVLGSDFAKSGLAVVIANLNCDFYAPAFMNEQLEVMTQCELIGEKSMVIQQRLVDKDTQIVKCVARTVMVGFDPKTLSSAPIPEALCNEFERYENRQLTNKL